MAIMYCPRDQRNVETVRGWSIGIFIILLIFTFLGAIIYYLLARKEKCPFCGSKDLMAPAAGAAVMTSGGMMAMTPGQPMMAQPMMMPAAQPAAAATQNCPSCGKPLTWYAQQNRWFCSAENKWL